MSTPAPQTEGKLRTLPRPVLIRRLRLAPDQEHLLDRQTSPLLDHLCDNNLLTAAARLLAYALPEREAVWWGCMCVGHTAAQCEEGERRALEAAEAWVWHPGEGHRTTGSPDCRRRGL